MRCPTLGALLVVLAGCGKPAWSGNCEPDGARSGVDCHLENFGTAKGHACFESHQTRRTTGKDFVSKTVCTDVEPKQTFKVRAEFPGVDIAKECATAAGGWACSGTMTSRLDQ